MLEFDSRRVVPVVVDSEDIPVAIGNSMQSKLLEKDFCHLWPSFVST
jgi:hypothetical protein